MTSTHPYVGFFPGLPLARNLNFGDWFVGTPSSEVPWRSDRLKKLTLDLLGDFDKSGFKQGALLWHREKGFDGVLPPADTCAAIWAAVAFAALDANDRLADVTKPYNLVTSENVAFFFQPIDEDKANVVHASRGLLRSINIIGRKIGDGPLPLPDATEPITNGLKASSALARAVFGAMTGMQDDRARRLQGALEWHRVAMTNSAAVSLPLRLVAIKTGFEALLGLSDSWSCAQALNELFVKVDKHSPGFLPWKNVLWSPHDRDVLPTNPGCPQKHKAVRRTEIQDWFMSLVDARNSIIHEGKLAAQVYEAPPERPLSRYAGNFFWIGERILREAIKASLGAGVLLAGRYPTAILKLLRSHPPESVEHDDESPSAPEERQQTNGEVARSLPEILSELRCPAANHIRLKKVHGGVGADIEKARWHAMKMVDKWSADFNGASLLISSGECKLLQDEGAEIEIPDFWCDCD